MNHLSTTVNPRQPDTLLRNTIQNLKNDGHCMAITTRGGKQIIDPPLPSKVEVEVTKNDNEIAQRSINVPLIKALEPIPGYANFMKDLSLVQKKEDPRAFTISCTIGLLHFAKALCDLGASINLMPLSIYKKLGLGDPKLTVMRLLMADRTMKRTIGVHHDVLVKVEYVIFSADFVILDCEVDFEFPIILGRPLLAIGRALDDMENGQMKF
ncbi:hypothetical protein R3W88_026874 [Solanum pinnatisectum]|uniref:Gag-asp_proteas domain-containing protein n=1 Tax=Solanum pinnatisectum TaxID=50273 RepID=A0AAV9LH14_9SOLN|nr:hypothetical protein R3W88_026874 [Solanum pinnatisectum]